MTYVRWTPALEDRIRELYATDMSLEEMAEASGLSKHTIQKRACKLGLTDIRRARRGASRAMKRIWKDPTYRANQRLGIKEYWAEKEA